MHLGIAGTDNGKQANRYLVDWRPRGRGRYGDGRFGSPAKGPGSPNRAHHRHPALDRLNLVDWSEFIAGGHEIRNVRLYDEALHWPTRAGRSIAA